jgi:hypothetical protein
LHSGATSAKCPCTRDDLHWLVAPCLSSLVSRPLDPFSPCAGVCSCSPSQTWLFCTLDSPTDLSIHQRISRHRCTRSTPLPPRRHFSPAYRAGACRRREGRRAPETDQRAARPNPLRHPERYKLPRLPCNTGSRHCDEPVAIQVPLGGHPSVATCVCLVADAPLMRRQSSAFPDLAHGSPRTGCLKAPKMQALGLELTPSSTGLAALTSRPGHAQSSTPGVQPQK